MIKELFLTCALAAPAYNFTHVKLTEENHIQKEEEQLKEWLRKNNPDAEVFITPKGQTDRLKEHGYERVPFNWRGNEIWIRRKEISDRNAIEESA